MVVHIYRCPHASENMNTYELCTDFVKRNISGPNKPHYEEPTKFVEIEFHRLQISNYECSCCKHRYPSYEEMMRCMILCSAMAKSSIVKRQLATQMREEKEAEDRHQKQQRALVEAEQKQMVKAKKEFLDLLFLRLLESEAVGAQVVVSSPTHTVTVNALWRKHELAIERADKSLQWLLFATDFTPVPPRVRHHCSLCRKDFEVSQSAVDCFMAHVPNPANAGPPRVVRPKRHRTPKPPIFEFESCELPSPKRAR